MLFVKLGIFNEFMGLENNYINACKELDIEYEVIDIISCDWIENIRSSDCDGYLVRPSYKKDAWKRMYDERLYYINYITDKPVYPVYNDIFLHESKKNMAYWLQVHDLPHPKTWVFYNKKTDHNWLFQKKRLLRKGFCPVSIRQPFFSPHTGPGLPYTRKSCFPHTFLGR